MSAYRRQDGESPSEAVVRALADANDAPPEDLRPLYDSIDPEALDSLFDRPDVDNGQVTFEHQDYLITVHSTGDIGLDEVSE